MRIELGPLPARSVRAWVENARIVLEGVRRAGPRLPVVLPDAVGRAFDGYLDEWQAVAEGAETFRWSADIDDEHVRHLVVYWFGLMTLDDETWDAFGLPFAPPESEPFYVELSTKVTEALAAADEEVGASIKASWPADTSIAQRPSVDRPMRVVVVDDTPDVRLMLSVALSADGRFDIAGEAENGEVGAQLCREVQPDGVLLDLMMPVMDGLTALPLIRRACPSARVVVLSADDDPTTVSRAMAAGADSFVTKGVALGRTFAALLG